MHSLININTFNKDDTAVQMARCSFDIHVQEILGIFDEWSYISDAPSRWNH